MNIFERDVSDSVKLPVILYRAANKRFPTGWLFKLLSVVNLYCNSSSINGSTSDNETNTFLISPTANISNSSRNLPLDDPSSATDTIAVISKGNCFKPLSSTDRPVPPPKTTIFFIFHLLTIIL